MESVETPRKIDANDLASSIYYTVAWDELHGFHEAALSDCPFTEITDAVFNVRRLSKASLAATTQNKEVNGFLRAALKASPALLSIKETEESEQERARVVLLCEMALRVHRAACNWKAADHKQRAVEADQILVKEVAGASTEIRPWSLPNIEAPLSEGESKHDVVQDVMQVRFVKPGAAIPSPVPRDIAQAFLDRVTDSSAYAEGVESQSVIGSVQNALSVQKDSQALEFFSTVFTSTSNLDIEPLGPSLDETVYRLHRHNHLATMSLLRQLYSLGILVPVFGVLLSQNFVSMHVDWPSEASGCMEADSAFFACEGDESDIKQWDLRKPADVLEVVFILDNLREYASTEFACRLAAGIESAQARILQGQFRPWKWDGKLLIAQDDDETSDEASAASTSLDTDVDEGQGRSDRQPAVAIAVPCHEGETAPGAQLVPPEDTADGKLLSPPYTPGDSVHDAAAA